MAVVQAILDGLMIGGVYAVISIGLTLVFGVMGIVNFAQAEFLMLGMFVASISQTIVEGHGGRIWAEPSPWGGAAFHFTLDRAD